MSEGSSATLIPGNLHRLEMFVHRLRRLWRLVLLRRSQRGYVCWERLQLLLTGGFHCHVFCILTPCNDLTLAIQGGSRMRRRARTVLCGGRQVTGIPTATGENMRTLSIYQVRISSPGTRCGCCVPWAVASLNTDVLVAAGQPTS